MKSEIGHTESSSFDGQFTFRAIEFYSSSGEAKVAQVATRPSLESDGDISQVTDDPRSGTVQRKSRSSRTTTTRHVGSVVRS